jgi:hypothetical protein
MEAKGRVTWLPRWLYRHRVAGGILLLYVLIAVAILSPLAHEDMPDTPAQDLANHVSGIIEAGNALREGQFPIRVAPHQIGGSRYPAFQYYGNFPYTIGGLLYRLHMGPYQALKLVVVLGLVTGAFFTYLCGRLLVRRHPPAAVAGAVFLTAPYILTDLHARLAFVELVSLCLLPAVLYTTLRAFARRRLTAVLANGIAWALLMLTHNITLLFGSLFIAAYVLSRTPLNRRGLGRLVRVGAAYAVGVALAAWYLVPQLNTLPMLLITEIHSHPKGSTWLTPLGALLAPTQVLGCPFPRPLDNPRFGLQVGWPTLIAVGLVLCYRIQPGRGTRALHRHSMRLLVLFAVALVGAWSPLNLWDHLPRLFHYIQFSYRLLGLVVLFGSLLVAVALHCCFRGRMSLEHAAVCLCLLGLSAGPYLGPHPSSDKVSVAGEIDHPDMGRGGGTGNYRLSAAARTFGVQYRATVDRGDFLDMHKTWPKTTHGRVNVYHDELQGPTFVELAVLAYPDLLRVFDNGKAIPYGVYGENVLVHLPPGEHVVEVHFAGTRWANWVSLIAGVGVGLGLMWMTMIRWRRSRADRHPEINVRAFIHWRMMCYKPPKGGAPTVGTPPLGGSSLRAGSS